MVLCQVADSLSKMDYGRILKAKRGRCHGSGTGVATSCTLAALWLSLLRGSPDHIWPREADTRPEWT